jgi:hypothetical protein
VIHSDIIVIHSCDLGRLEGCEIGISSRVVDGVVIVGRGRAVIRVVGIFGASVGGGIIVSVGIVVRVVIVVWIGEEDVKIGASSVGESESALRAGTAG